MLATMSPELTAGNGGWVLVWALSVVRQPVRALPFAGLGGLWIRGGQARPPNLTETRDLLAALALLWEI